ncbi:GNAT family N-acetyltransferase [Marinilongibacter aquaticus]|uniref:GNAT family N-acetyltransferase n=1 Tax=Marinilongibacter aquaticus TaxID=2975157 RepID=UPI0021BD5E73|nr:GNAT family N-acetyltransferase [Marinilongibacter aquaticus]UBM57760.1 GNAT family N-acetyltransferase [Marinilongibacter aquaticus]
MSIEITKAKTEEELQGIIALQNRNLRDNLTQEEMDKQGFVTLAYDLDFLRAMPAGNHHIIAKDGEQVIGYVLLMDRSTNHMMKEGAGIFPIFHELEYKGQKMKEVNYVSVGQVCVDKDYAGQGLLGRMYAHYRASYKDLYEMAMTDISYQNARSLKGHLKAGFQVLKRFYEPDAEEMWDIVIWDWRE